MLDVANTQTIKLFINGEEFSMFSGTVLHCKLSLNMNKGITVREVIWRSPNGIEVRIIIKRMASFYQLSLFTIEYEIELLNYAGDLVIESGHDINVSNYFDPNDPRIACEVFRGINPLSCEIKDGASYITSFTTESGLEVCSCVKNILSKETEKEFLVSNTVATCIINTKVKQNEKLTLTKYSVFCDSIRHDNCRGQVNTEMQIALSVPLKYFYDKQEEYLEEYWNNCFVEIDGNDELNTALQYNLYQLIQSVGKDNHSNIAPKGLSGEGYEGHFFWDSEIYIHPFFTITNPDISKNLIDFRYETLNYARENARVLGHSLGALYPWRTIMGRECSGYFPAGSAQYHINADIAYSIITYYLATKDIEFIRKKGAEIIFETARIWINTGNFYNNEFHINDVTGPDEYTCIVNNNYYTNVMARNHLRWAVKFYYLLKNTPGFNKLVNKIELKEEEIKSFDNAAEKMYLPYDKELNINPQDDSFLKKRKWPIESIPKEKFPLLLHYHPLHLYRHQICKQADTVLAHFLLEDAQSEEVMLNSFEYYEKITTHDSSLSKSIFSIMAARFGMEEKAVDYFGNSIMVDLMDHFNNTRDGIHTANMAGNYMAIVYGFGGFRLKEQGISFSPILPKDWKAYRFKIRFEECLLMVEVTVDNCTFLLECGTAKKIFVYGKEYLFENTLIISRN